MKYIEIAATNEPITPKKNKMVPNPGLLIIVIQENVAVTTQIPSNNMVLLATPSRVILDSVVPNPNDSSFR
jgi:hypothetical protein